MSKVFVVADTHFGHKSIIRWSRQQFKTIEEHDEAIVEAWNEAVTNRDVVYHLGDVAWSAEGAKNMARLNGKRKYLVAGNHDDPRIVSRYFDQVMGAVNMGKRGVILTHIPIHPQEFYRWRYNLHGHLHASHVEIDGRPDRRYICTSLEHIGAAPVELDQLIEERRNEVLGHTDD